MNFGWLGEGDYSSTCLKTEHKVICSSGNTAHAMSVEERLKSMHLHLGLLLGLHV